MKGQKNDYCQLKYFAFIRLTPLVCLTGPQHFFVYITYSAGADLIFVQNNAVTLPSSKIFRIHYFTDNSSGVIESTDLYISFIDQFEAGSLERSRGVRGEFQTIQACTTVVPDEWRW